MDKVPNKPKFLCGRCQDVLCEDCSSVAGEYEYLYEGQKLVLMHAQQELHEAQQRIAALKNDVEMWQAVAKAGMPAVIQVWMDSEVAKARKAGRESMRRELKKSGFLAKLEKAEKALAEVRK